VVFSEVRVSAFACAGMVVALHEPWDALAFSIPPSLPFGAPSSRVGITTNEARRPQEEEEAFRDSPDKSAGPSLFGGGREGKGR
jgi:hypothetical protein